MTTAVTDLARTADFRLGPLLVRPSYRELAHVDGRREVIEPRVMQVLVALATADGVVGRDKLTARCWVYWLLGRYQDSIAAAKRWGELAPRDFYGFYFAGISTMLLDDYRGGLAQVVRMPADNFLRAALEAIAYAKLGYAAASDRAVARLRMIGGDTIKGVADGVSNERIALAVTAVPETATWMMLIRGFSLIGGTMRRRRGIATRALSA